MAVHYPNTTFVNVYRIDRAYGGPEEGGWYFTYGEFSDGTAVPDEREEDVEHAKSDAQARCDALNENRNSDIGSVLSEGQYVVMVESHPGKDFPETQPYYE